MINLQNCLLYTSNAKTHEIILGNLDKAPMYNGSIASTGPRYCPSIEDKVVKFNDKDSHHLFLEPEGFETTEVYILSLIHISWNFDRIDNWKDEI